MNAIALGVSLILLARGTERTLFVYGPGDESTPRQTIALERDEADDLAELLHSSSVPDRLAVVERRLADLTTQAR
jgi:TrkA domain protein